MAGIYDIQCKCIYLVKYDTLSLSYNFFPKLLGAFKSGICIKFMLLKKEIAVLLTHYS